MTIGTNIKNRKLQCTKDKTPLVDLKLPSETWNNLSYNTRKDIAEKKISASILSMSNDVVRCPKCGSTSITTGARGYGGFWMNIGATQTVNRCAKCGNTWKPKYRG